MSKKVRLGIIGTGGISHSHMQGYQRLENAEVIAVCDINQKRVDAYAERYKVDKVYYDFNEMLKLKELDAVSVTTWNNVHADATIAALNAGKHVLCEKPMALNTAQAIEMQKAAQKSGKLLMIGFVKRFMKDTDVIKEFVDKDYLGQIYYAKATYLRRCGSPGGWFADRKRSGGGPLIDLGVHVIDEVRYLTGKPKAVSVYGATFSGMGVRGNIKGFDRYTSADYSKFSDVEDLAVAMIRFDNGTVLSLETSFSLNLKTEDVNLQLFGTKAGAKLEPVLEIYSEMEDYLVDIAPKMVKDDQLFNTEMAHFVDCIANGTKCKSPAEDGVELMKIIDAVYESARTGREVILA